jgi:hypothetical protein
MIEFDATMKDLNVLTVAQIAQRLQNRLKCQVAPTYDVPEIYLTHECRDAAVLIPFIRIQDAWHLLFIRRSKSGVSHV